MDRTFSELEDLDRDLPPSIKILPAANLIKIGGQSIMDRGRAAVYPLLDEIVALKEAGHQLLIFAGGGTRARHMYSLALDLDLPTGALAALGAATARQNGLMLQMLLAKHGAAYLWPDDFEKLPLYFKLGCLPIMSGMPPFEYYEKLPETGRIPPHRTDTGMYLAAEYLGAKNVIFVKDEDGLYTGDPKKDPEARFLPKIKVAELLAMDLPDLGIERALIHYMPRAQHVRQVQIINGLKPGLLTRAMNGEHVGTIITVD
ncbi:MAG: uridine kinase [Cyanobacteria bacterium NC_groundwater_1444_Ag_S-0.65um_54_12]|nr:uridine kinase [Cyanobacteria bacterium NC_groundwater_1444_Ag_S-0.65um_54_12]